MLGYFSLAWFEEIGHQKIYTYRMWEKRNYKAFLLGVKVIYMCLCHMWFSVFKVLYKRCNACYAWKWIKYELKREMATYNTYKVVKSSSPRSGEVEVHESTNQTSLIFNKTLTHVHNLLTQIANHLTRFLSDSFSYLNMVRQREICLWFFVSCEGVWGCALNAGIYREIMVVLRVLSMWY